MQQHDILVKFITISRVNYRIDNHDPGFSLKPMLTIEIVTNFLFIYKILFQI